MSERIENVDSTSTIELFEFMQILLSLFLSATEYHSDADYKSRRVGVVVVVVVVVRDFKKWITF